MSSSANRRQRRVAARAAQKQGHTPGYAMPDVQDGRYVSVVVFQPGSDKDILGQVWRDLGDDGIPGPWTVSYRFRYYQDNKRHDSSDVKNSWQWIAPNEPEWTEERVVNLLLGGIGQACRDGFGDPTEMSVIEIKSDRAEDFMNKLSDQPWFSGRIEGAPDA